MTPTRRSKVATIALVVAALVCDSAPTLATCGGGGGGGVGGARAGGSRPTETQAYRVPWTVVGPSEVVPGGALGVFWFPSSAAEAKESSLLTSRTLALISARCVALAIVTPDNASVRTKYEIPELGSGVVLVDESAAVIGRVAPEGKPISAGPVEKLLKAANEKIKQQDLDAATYFVELGRPDKALALLRRHFTVYEKFDAVRAKEMQEARDDVAFAPLRKEQEFISMTAKADRDAASHR